MKGVGWGVCVGGWGWGDYSENGYIGALESHEFGASKDGAYRARGNPPIGTLAAVGVGAVRAAA